MQDRIHGIRFAVHALWAAVAHAPKAVERVRQPFDVQGPRCKSVQSGVRLHHQPTSKARKFQGTYSFVCDLPPCDANPPDSMSQSGSPVRWLSPSHMGSALNLWIMRSFVRMRRCWGRALTDDDLSQSSTYLHGFPVCDSTRSRTKSRRTCTRL
jgi:hypothetical protein